MSFCLNYCSIRFSPKSLPISAKFWCVGDSTTFPCSAYRRACWTCMMQLKKPAASVHFLCLCCGWHKMSAPAGDYTVRLTVSRNTWSNSWRTLTFLVAQRRKKQNRATQASLTGFWSASAGEGLDQTGVHQKTQVSLFYIVIEFLMWMCGLNVSLAVFS